MERQQNLENALFSKSSSDSHQNFDSHSPLIDFHFLTLFPELFSVVLGASLLGRAQKKSLVRYHLTQIRDFTQDKHKTVDDTPYGGGEGMVLKADVLYSAWKSVASEPSELKPHQKQITLLLSPQGQVLTQEKIRNYSTYSKIILICGHYEGVDERFIEYCVDEEVSIGDYILTGGELPALVLADAVTRLVPGVVQNERSISQESLENGLLKYPQFTRPKEFQGSKVPELLMSGNHQAISEWREQQMKERTQTKRPDLWQKYLNLKKE